MYLPWLSYAHALYFTVIASYIHLSEAGCILMYALVILGDFNARVGNKRGKWREVMGGCGEETCNDNGRRLLEYWAMNGLIVSNMWHKHKEIHKCTCECRGRGLKSILDYFLVRRQDSGRFNEMKLK